MPDLDAIDDLLTRGFPHRSREYWISGLLRRSMRDVPEDLTRFRYLLDREETPLGALLSIYTARDNSDGISIYRNLSSWYLEPGFGGYAPLLSTVRQRAATSPATTSARQSDRAAGLAEALSPTYRKSSDHARKA